MLNARLFLVAAFISTNCFGAVSFQQKQLRVAALSKLQKLNPSLSGEAYQRELNYERLDLSVDDRAKNETNLLADKIRKQVLVAYKAALKEHQNPEIAHEKIKGSIEKDLELASPELKAELLLLATSTLNSADAGGISEEVDLPKIKIVKKKEIIKRKAYLNEVDPAIFTNENTLNDAEKRDYESKAELLESLRSTRQSSNWVSTSSQTIKTVKLTKNVATISMEVKFEFLGAAIDAGPSISFKREYSTEATIMAEGFSPLLMKDGNFDYYKRNVEGNIIRSNNQNEKRLIFFTCNSALQFESEYVGSGGFKVMGMGADVSTTNVFANTVSLASRRILLPETVGNKTVTIQFISELCHKDFLNTKFNHSMTISDSLDSMMKNIVSSLTFSHPKTKCAVDEQCYDWFNNKIISLAKVKNFPRCAEGNSREKFRSCQLRGLQGQNCTVYEAGKQTSDGQFEFGCDVGLKCVKYQNQKFFMGSVWSYAKGQCQVINNKTYRNPFDIGNDQNEISIELINK